MNVTHRDIEIFVNDKEKINATLSIVARPKGIIIFAHGSGSSRLSPRNQFVAEQLQQRGFATLLLDLLTEKEDRQDALTRQYRFDIPLLTLRLVAATNWVLKDKTVGVLPVGYFGASTGAAAALAAAGEMGDTIKAVASRGGRPDLAIEMLPKVKAPTLLIVGENDFDVIDMNKRAAEKLNVKFELSIVPGATHLFEEPGALKQAALLAADWFAKYITYNV